MARPFDVPWTLNDENEFSLPVLPWFFTNQELGVAILGTMASYLAMAPLIGMGIANLIAMFIAGILIMQWITTHKKGRPASWLWDLRLALGFLPEQRGMVKSTAGVRWLSAKHIAQPSVFIAGAKRPGEDLTISAPWMSRLPPVIDLAPIIPPRRKRRWSTAPSLAPAWFEGADGFETIITPRIPVSYTWDEIPAGSKPSSKAGSAASA